MSTFLKERDLAGLKVCSVRSSPSILSVQSERGASCNSKLRGQSPPGPPSTSPRAQHRAAEHMQRDDTSSLGRGGAAACTPGPQSQPAGPHHRQQPDPYLGKSSLKHRAAT